MLTNEQTVELISEIERLKLLLSCCMQRTADFNAEVLDLTAGDSGPHPLTPERFVFRIKAILEECEEAIAAYNRGDDGEVIDAFLDGNVFSLGAIIEMGVPAGYCFEDIIQANLTKKKGKLAKRPESGGNDAVKPEGWKPPNHDWVFHLSPVAVEIAKLHAAKNDDYGHWSEYFPFGHTGFQQVLWMKMKRMMNLNPDRADSAPKFESLRDTVLDMMNYCDFYAQWLNNPSVFPEVNKYGSK